jgi:hypothetical protein
MRDLGTTAVPAAAAALGLALLTGCSGAPDDGSGVGETVCPAIGWSNLLRVTLEGDTSDVAEVRVCDDEGCWPDPEASPGAGPLGDVTSEGDTWSFSVFDLSTSDPATIQVLDSAGEVVVESEVPVEWVQVGGTAECGGPHVGTAVVTL